MEQTLLTEKQAAEMTGYSVHWFRRKRWSGGGIQYVQLGGKSGAVRYRAADIERFIQERIKQSTSDPGQAA